MKNSFKLAALCLAFAGSYNVHAQSTTAGNTATGTAPNATEYLGFSTSGYDLSFRTSNAEKMRILSSTGDIGIGLAAPGARLDVFKTSAVQLRLSHSTLAYTDFQTTSVGTLLINPKTPIGGILPKIGFNVTLPSANFHSNLGNFKLTDPASTTRGILFYPSVGANGEVPGGSCITSTGTTASEGLSLMTSAAVIDSKLAAFAYDNLGGNWKSVWETKNASGNPNLLLVKNGGNVGVGTSNPTARLTVNGNVLIGDPATVTIMPAGFKMYVEEGILTEKVKVMLVSDWADYVFAKDYKLRPLSEVESFVNENKHLPGIASAEELQKQGGFDVAKMDAKLLEKIEELTLYIIELNKQNKDLAERLSKLEKNK